MHREFGRCRMRSSNMLSSFAIDGRKVTAPLPSGAHGELSMKRSFFDALLLTRARALGAEVREETTVAAVSRTAEWKIETSSGAAFAPQ